MLTYDQTHKLLTGVICQRLFLFCLHFLHIDRNFRIFLYVWPWQLSLFWLINTRFNTLFEDGSHDSVLLFGLLYAVWCNFTGVNVQLLVNECLVSEFVRLGKHRLLIVDLVGHDQCLLIHDLVEDILARMGELSLELQRSLLLQVALLGLLFLFSCATLVDRTEMWLPHWFGAPLHPSICSHEFLAVHWRHHSWSFLLSLIRVLGRIVIFESIRPKCHSFLCYLLTHILIKICVGEIIFDYHSMFLSSLILMWN